MGNASEDQMTNKRTLSQHPEVTTAETTCSKKGPQGDLHRLRGGLSRDQTALNWIVTEVISLELGSGES